MKFNNLNVYISSKAKIGKNVRIGDNTAIYDNVEIGDDSVVANNCIIGEPLGAYYSDEHYENPKTVIGKNALIRSNTIIYADSTFGDHLNTGHGSVIREKTTMGNHCSVGVNCMIQGDNSVFGDYCRLHISVVVGKKSTVGNYVFMYPFVVLTNDPHPPSNINVGPVVGDFTQIASHSILLPGVKVGKNCLIGANTTVTKDVPDDSIMVGNPGKIIGPISRIMSKEFPDKSHYPWVYHFERGMPWEGIGYDKWQELNTKHQ